MTRDEPYLFVERDRCPACLSQDVEVVYESRFNEGPVAIFVRDYYGIDPGVLGHARFSLRRCSNCSLLYQAWVGDERLLAELYGEWINESGDPAHDPVYTAVMAHPLESRDAHEMLSAAAFLGKEPCELCTLDHGMGWAMWARVARALGCRSYGTELSPSREEFARAHGIAVVPANVLPQQQFDFINTEQVMEHLPQLRETAERLRDALRPGGVLKISVPSADHVASVIQKLSGGHAALSCEELMPVQPLEHVNSFTSQSILTLAASLGLNVVRPSIPDRYAFLSRPGTLSARRFSNSVKELVRPFYTYRNRSNLYFWLQKGPA
ncbi:class I SAM-dependent methyltransferase [Sphingomonas hankyongi]|uniref:Class I SAM-dependent methyltransferase n=1 Tax=Sphingomonas hankyongi TaxID=2908209 RepID=A0ABT0S2Q0_9SPHN|nr:class I SAM-dependent methyltransferase [Sphingomonas hankyongi]MCL6730150.1 class I SAM-dependent methyltransferase [Sphingomonas hankyongi]